MSLFSAVVNVALLAVSIGGLMSILKDGRAAELSTKQLLEEVRELGRLVRAASIAIAEVRGRLDEHGANREADRRRELAERAVAYADQLGGSRAQRLAHALAAHRLLSDGAIGDNVARVEIEAVLARRKPAPAPGAGEKGVVP